MGPKRKRFCRSFMVAAVTLVNLVAASGQDLDPALQLAENPPMEIIMESAPPLPEPTEDFEVRKGFTLVDNLDDFRAAIKENRQKIRLKPGHYVAKKLDEPLILPEGHFMSEKGQVRHEHVFFITSSNSHFDMRGAVITIPSSLKGKMARKAHVADNWRVGGSRNTIEGGYFRTETDQTYPKYFGGGNLFEVHNKGNKFIDCIFHVKGSSPFGYSDYYGKGSKNWTPMNKHSFMSLNHANKTVLKGCRIYHQAFGHAIHFHKVSDVLIEDCYFTGALRRTRDIFKEKTGLAREHGFNIMYRGERPIPRDQVIPLTEDGIRTYDECRNIIVRDTTVARFRNSAAFNAVGDVRLENVQFFESGDHSIIATASENGRVIVKNCTSDVAYNPVFGTGHMPAVRGKYEVTIINAAKDVEFTPRSNLGTICGVDCHFILHDGTERPLPPKVNVLTCGGKYPLTESLVENYTPATIVLEKNVTKCVIRSAGQVIDRGKGNRIVRL